MNDRAKQVLEASGTVVINGPLSFVFEKLTIPNEKYSWIDKSGDGFLISDWTVGNDVFVQNKSLDNQISWKGKILEINKDKTIKFTLHDALAEEEIDEEYGPDWNEEIYVLNFSEQDDRTQLTFEFKIFDNDPVEENNPDFKMSIPDQKEYQTKIIPERLKLIKEFCEN